jgi:hypothetical protein
MSLADIALEVNADQARRVMVDTWGHLAPSKGKTYPLNMVVAVGHFDALNPIVLTCTIADEADCGPWFFNAVNTFISDRLGRDENSGKLFRFVGHWRNYRFVGKFQEISLDASRG